MATNPFSIAPLSFFVAIYVRLCPVMAVSERVLFVWAGAGGPFARKKVHRQPTAASRPSARQPLRAGNLATEQEKGKGGGGHCAGAGGKNDRGKNGVSEGPSLSLSFFAAMEPPLFEIPQP